METFCKTCNLIKRETGIKLFTVIRQADESGHSGIGHIITGIIFEDGQVVIRWNTPTASTAIYRNFEEFHKLHIGQHPGNQSIVNVMELDTTGGFMAMIQKHDCHTCHKPSFFMKVASVKDFKRQKNEFNSLAGQLRTLLIRANNIVVSAKRSADELGFGKNLGRIFFDLSKLIRTNLDSGIKSLKNQGDSFFINVERLAAGGFRAAPVSGRISQRLTSQGKLPQEGVEKITATLSRVSSKMNHDTRQGIVFSRAEVAKWKRTKFKSKKTVNKNIDKVLAEYTRITTRANKHLAEVKRIRA
ncbi:MAG: hypothetical protein V3U54_13055 [Thermodesulfobacteriota bacterium]